ncbi:hypothetical protein BU15DRAFT_82344 [Melanogaster broomeanus]|nr:hypothetical protein BU15DRAFT_82344 [Melanogaster broomeanus]
MANSSSSLAKPPGATSNAGPSIPQAGPSTFSDHAPEGRTSSFVQSDVGSDDSWDDMDSCDKFLDYFCIGPRLDRERFRPWKKKCPAAIEADRQNKGSKTRVRCTTKKVAPAQKGHASPDEAMFEHLADSQLQEPVEVIHRQRDDEATVRQKAETEGDGLLIEVMELRCMGHRSAEPLERQMHSDASSFADSSSSMSNAGKDHRVHPLYHRDSQWEHTKIPHAPHHINEATSQRIGESGVDCTLVGNLQRQEHTAGIHPRLYDEAARQKADTKMDKENKELRDIIIPASCEPRQTHPGLSVVEAGPSSSFAEPSCSTSNAG